MKPNGFSTTSVLIALGIGSATALLVADLTTAQMDAIRLASRIQEKLEFETQLLRALSDEKTCSCQVSAELNSSLASQLVVDESSPNPPDIDMGKWRSSCDFSSPSSVMAETGTKVNGMKLLSVRSVKLRNIHKIGDGRYASQLTIDYEAGMGEMELMPSILNLAFEIDTSAGSSSARPIKRCIDKQSPDEAEADTEELNNCPPDMELIGTAGTEVRYCIDINERSAKTYSAAEAECSALSFNGRYIELCDGYAMGLACLKGTLMANRTNNWEWVNSNPYIHYVGLNGGCASEGARMPSSTIPYPFRCCIW
ncbi:MAG: hypothetical protein HC902_01120 [Calothrix sp. SM1_5_4]|nr:hypothetical protein [Calothrix sp. SM1_5_4]